MSQVEPSAHTEDGTRADRAMSIQAASRWLNVPAPTLRSWERRYGLNTARSVGGHRRYLTSDLKVLAVMRNEIALGRPAREAAEVARATLQPSRHDALVHDFLHAADAYDASGVGAVLSRAEQVLGLGETIDDVVLPAMRQIGRWWEIGRCDVAHEQLATGVVRAWLAPHRPRAARSPSRSALFSCGPRDAHTIGSEAMSALMRRLGWRCDSLGARTTVEALRSALTGKSYDALILVSHLRVGRRQAVEALRAVQPLQAELFYAGNAFLTARSRIGVPGTYLGESIRDAVALVEARVSSARRCQTESCESSSRSTAPI